MSLLWFMNSWLATSQRASYVLVLGVAFMFSWQQACKMAEYPLSVVEVAMTNFPLHVHQHVYKRKCCLHLESETIAKQETPWSS